jgi:hypothetical protein
MYAALYRKLPGGPVLKSLCLVAILAAVVAALFFFVFPMIETLIAEDPSVDG